MSRTNGKDLVALIAVLLGVVALVVESGPGQAAIRAAQIAEKKCQLAKIDANEAAANMEIVKQKVIVEKSAAAGRSIDQQLAEASPDSSGRRELKVAGAATLILGVVAQDRVDDLTEEVDQLAAKKTRLLREARKVVAAGLVSSLKDFVDFGVTDADTTQNKVK
jgi:hypothetical protein